MSNPKYITKLSQYELEQENKRLKKYIESLQARIDHSRSQIIGCIDPLKSSEDPLQDLIDGYKRISERIKELEEGKEFAMDMAARGIARLKERDAIEKELKECFEAMMVFINHVFECDTCNLQDCDERKPSGGYEAAEVMSRLRIE